MEGHGERRMESHTLLLVQFNSSVASRTFLDYESLAEAMDGVCGLYEKEPNVATLCAVGRPSS